MASDGGLHAELSVGLCAFDSQLYFFDLQREGEDEELPQMSIVPDIDDPFVPTPRSRV